MDADRRERGDFQTPAALAREIVALLRRRGLAPRGLLEPTCGAGALLVEAARGFPAARALGLELDPGHVGAARAAVEAAGLSPRVTVRRADVFLAPLRAEIEALPAPVLVVGNPPWVTAAALGALPPRGGRRGPAREAAPAGVAGLDRITGRSNFDVGEWILLRLLEAIAGRPGDAVALLVKASAARRALAAAVRSGLAIASAEAFRVDARRAFGVSADALLLLCRAGPAPEALVLRVHPDLAGDGPAEVVRLGRGGTVADAAAHARAAGVEGEGAPWRSGVKHDCAPVLELVRGEGGALANGLGEAVDVEPDLLYPLAKGGDLARGAAAPARLLLLPQRRLGEDTRWIAGALPRTGRYLERHGARLAARRSRVYAGRPAWAVFGVGPYTFAPWKVAVAGLAKALRFEVLGPREGRPVVLDDTCYFLPARDGPHAHALRAVLDAAPARDLFGALAFTADKRPWTKAVLVRLDLAKAAARLLGDGAGALDPEVRAEVERIAGGFNP